jgi:drug/metabolite transporter (DMT)-like permease/preprotein translocase subunit Sec61beta
VGGVHRAKPWVGLVLAAVSGILYGAITVASKAAHAHPLAKGLVSALAAGIGLAPFLRGFRAKREDAWRLGVMTLVGGALAPALILYGLQRTTAVHAGLLLTVELVATAILALLFLHERLTWRSGLGLVALLGAGVAVAFASADSGSSSFLGLALVGLSAVAFSVDNTVSTTLTGGYRPWHLIAVKSLLAAPVLALCWLVVGGNAPERMVDWLLLIAVGLVGVGGSSVLLYIALRSIGAARSMAINIPISGLAAAAGGWLIGEHIGWLDGVALALVAGGIGLLWEKDEAEKEQRAACRTGVAQKNKGPGIQSAAGLIRYYDDEEESSFKLAPSVVLVFAAIVGIAVVCMKVFWKL